MFFAISFLMFSQSELGRYNIRNYTTKEYKAHSQNWWIRKSPQNYIYSANTNGLLQYDGQRWKTILLSNLSTARSFAFNRDQVLFLGGEDDFGYLKPDKVGQLQFQSLIDKVDSNLMKVGTVWRTHSINDKIYFQTASYIYSYDGNKFSYIKAENNFHMSFVLKNEFYVLDIGIGIKKLVGHSLKLIKNGDKYKENRLRGYVEYDSSKILIASDTKMYLYDGNVFEPFSAENNLRFKDAMIYKLIELSSGDFALATRFQGIFILAKNGNIKQIIDESNGLAMNRVWDVYEDSERQLWAALDNGISKIDIHSPFTIFTKAENGDKGLDFFIRFKNNLYRSSSFGIYRLKQKNNSENAKFIKIDGLNSRLWDLKIINNDLFVASNSGLYQYNGKRFQQIINGRVRWFIQSKQDKKRIIYLKDIGIASTYKDKGFWVKENKFPELNIKGRFLVEDIQEQLFIGTDLDGVVRVDLTDIENDGFRAKYKFYNLNHGIPNMRNNYTFKLDGNVLVATKSGPYRYNNVTDRFELDHRFDQKIFNGKRWVFFIQEDHNDNIFMSTGIKDTEVKGISFFRKNFQGDYLYEEKIYKYMRDYNIRHAYPEKNGIVWFASPDAAFRYDSNKDVLFHKFKAKISSAMINEDSIFYGGVKFNKREVVLKHNENNLRFFASPLSYLLDGKYKFQYQLEGYDTNWSKWTSEAKKDYTNLSSGTYTFKVRAKNFFDEISEVDQLSFQILAPWYLTLYSKIFYLICLCIFIYIIVKIRSRNLEKKMIKLEKIVKARTTEIKRQADQLKELDQAKSRFFANISHEFRTPLTLIKGPLESFCSGNYAGNFEVDSQKALKHTIRLLDLTNQFLDLSKLESGSLKLNFKKADLIRFLKLIFVSFESYAESKNMEFTFTRECESFHYIFDPERLEIVIINLLSNAFKFTDRKGKIELIFKLEKNQKPIIVVKDTGIGIMEKNLDYIFKRFYQVDSSDTRAYQGSGIGLALCKELIDLHGGHINVLSKINEGTKFIIELPVKNEANQKYENYEFDQKVTKALFDEEKPKKSDVPEFESKNEKILVVEDNRDLREYIKDILSDYYQCFEAENGEKGLELAENEDIDLILSDVMMPKMDGFEFCKQLKSSPKTSHLPVLLLTARSEDADKIKGLEFGADDYILKPFNQDELKLRINNVIKSRQLLREKYSRNILSDISEYASNATDEAFIAKLNDLIKEKISEADFDRNYLANELGLSLSNLYRKIKSLTDMSPAEYIKSIRLKFAVELLKTTNLNMTEISLEIGFNNSAHFSREFKKQFGVSPKDYVA